MWLVKWPRDNFEFRMAMSHDGEICCRNGTFGIMKYILHSLLGDMVDCHPSQSIVNLGSALVDNVSSGWQSKMSLRKECDIYIMIIHGREDKVS